MERRRYLLRAVLAFYTLLIVVVSLLPSTGLGVWHVDKIGHFLAYTGMAILIVLSFDAWPGRVAGLLGAIVLGMLLEWAQSFVPGRHMSWLDGMANGMGVLLGAVLGAWQGERIAGYVRDRWGG